MSELSSAETYRLLISQHDHFLKGVEVLKRDRTSKPCGSYLVPLHPFMDLSFLLRVGGMEQDSRTSYSCRHPCSDSPSHSIRTPQITPCQTLTSDFDVGPTLPHDRSL